jgi:sugar lactone lactonase YvrE
MENECNKSFDMFVFTHRSLQMASKEFKVLYRIFAYAGTILVILVIVGYILAQWLIPHFFEFSNEVKVRQVDLNLDEISSAVFTSGIEGCENLWLDPGSMRVLVTDLTGNISELNGSSRDSLKITNQLKLADFVTGIDVSEQHEIIAAACKGTVDDWKKTGGHLYQIDSSLTTATKIGGPIPSVNGIAFGPEGRLYVTSSNFNAFDPKGQVLSLDFENPIDTKVVIHEAGMANGLYYEHKTGEFLLSNTVEGIFRIYKDSFAFEPVYFKTAFMEYTDDICKDDRGNLWMTDPGNSTVKVLIPGDTLLVRFRIKGIGQTSSCRTRIENGDEIIYITELKQEQAPMSNVNDGRGVLSVKLEELYGYIK